MRIMLARMSQPTYPRCGHKRLVVAGRAAAVGCAHAVATRTGPRGNQHRRIQGGKADPTCAPYGADRLAVTPDRNRLRKCTGPLAKVEVTGHHAAGDGGVLHRWPVAKPRRVATAVRLVRKRLRPRCSRDMTVPSGQSVRAAISLHENSKTSA